MKIPRRTVAIAVALFTLGFAVDLFAIPVQIDLGSLPSVITGPSNPISFSDLDGLAVNGSISVDISFAASQFVRLFSATDSDFDVQVELQTNGAGLVGFLNGSAYLTDSHGNPIPGYSVVGRSSDNAGAMDIGLFPLLKDSGGTPNTDLSRPLDFYGVHFDITLPNDPGLEITDARFFLNDSGPYGIGPNTPTDVPDYGSSLSLFGIALGLGAAARRIKASSLEALRRES